MCKLLDVRFSKHITKNLLSDTKKRDLDFSFVFTTIKCFVNNFLRNILINILELIYKYNNIFILDHILIHLILFTKYLKSTK
jgi:hypothetical protein